MERCLGRSDVRSVDAHGIKRHGVYDVEAAASIHQHLSEALHADDWVNHERIPPQLWDAIRVVGSVEGVGGLRPPEERWRGWLGRVDLAMRELSVALGVISRHPTEDHEAVIRRQKATILPLSVIYCLLRLLPLVPPFGATR